MSQVTEPQKKQRPFLMCEPPWIIRNKEPIWQLCQKAVEENDEFPRFVLFQNRKQPQAAASKPADNNRQPQASQQTTTGSRRQASRQQQAAASNLTNH